MRSLGDEIKCPRCGQTIKDPYDKKDCRQYPPFNFVHIKCAETDALADLVKVAQHLH